MENGKLSQFFNSIWIVKSNKNLPIYAGENIHMICIHFYPNPYEIANCFLRERFQRGCHSYFKENVGKISHHIDLPGL